MGQQIERGLSIERLRSLLEYDPATGLIRWLNPKPAGFQQGAQVVGWHRGTSTQKPHYPTIRIKCDDGVRRVFRVHRLAVVLMEGAWPPAVVDHINRDKTDNRWGNLRHASRLQNQFNHTRHINNKSGVSGVAFDRNKRTWRAFIAAFGKRRDARKRTFEEAVKQRKEWESALYGGFAPAA